MTATEVGPAGACCVFVVDPSIPATARSGYASLVMAYSRADEPVCILDDGAALVLVREGGATSGSALARRVLEQMRKLALDLTLTAGVAVFGNDPTKAIAAARSAGESVAPGAIGRVPCSPSRSPVPSADPPPDHPPLRRAAAIRRGSASRRSCSSVRGSGIDQFGRSTTPGRFGRRTARLASSSVATTRRLGAVPNAA